MKQTTTPSAALGAAHQRVRRAAPALAGLALVGLLAGCSKDSGDGADAREKKTTTTEAAVTTTKPVPLDDSAADLGLAYLSTDASGTTVFLTDGKGAKTDVVAKVKGRAEALTWSPDGTRLLLDGDGGTEDFDLQVVDASSGAVTPIAPSPTSNEGGASWSPDGTKVAFFSNRDGGFAGYVVPAAGGAPIRVTPPEAKGVADLVWSPDGTQLAFSTSSDVNSDVWTVAADGSAPKKVSTVPGSTQPRWSPDGELLAISAQPLGAETSGIFTLDPATGTSERIADTQYHDGFPAWSGDGKQVFFVSAVPNDDAEGGSADDLYVIDAAGGKPRAITSDPISIESELQPSPNGKLLVFSVQRLGDKEVFVANADGTGAIPVSRAPERSDAWGAWRPTPAKAG